MYKIRMIDKNFPEELEMWYELFVDDLKDMEKFEDEAELLFEEERAEMIAEKRLCFGEREYRLWNTFLMPTTIFTKESEISIRWILYQGLIYRVGKYNLKGVCKKEEGQWKLCKCNGNPVLGKCYPSLHSRRKGGSIKRFSKDQIWSYGYIIMKCMEEITEKEIMEYEFGLEDISILMRDISGKLG